MESSCILRAGILSEGKVTGIQQREYKIFQPHDITLHVCSDINWAGMTFYVWDNANKQLSGNWPGKRVSTTKTIEGKRWYYQTYGLTSPDQYLNLVVSTTSGNKQTVDITGLRSDTFLCITGTQDTGKYMVEDQTAETTTGIKNIHNLQWSTSCVPSENIYDLSGRKVNSQFIIHNSQSKKDFYIINGKKVAGISHKVLVK